jgi:hypothetical protein
MYLRTILTEFGFPPRDAITLYEDNEACIALAREPQYHKGFRHVEVPHHYTRELTARGIVRLVYKKTADQLADMLTKALGPNQIGPMVTAILGGDGRPAPP